MATVVAMELDQSEGSSKGGSKTTGLLSINKSSGSRISKSSSSLRKNPSQQQQQQQASGNKPLPASKIYNTDPMGFRNLVQQLTGCDPPAQAQAQAQALPPPPPPPPPPVAATPPPVISYPPQMLHNQQQIDAQLQLHHHHHHQQQQQQMVFPDPGVNLLHQQSSSVGSPTSSGGGFSSGARPVNTRLQRMAPPPIPIRPAFSFNLAHRLQQQAQQQQIHQQNQGQIPANQPGEQILKNSGTSNPPEIPSPGAHPLSPISKRVSPMPLLSFSPLPVLSPSDNAWASFESPNTAAMKQLAQSILDGKSPGPLPGARFPWSPLGLQSPGLAPELFPDVKMIEGDYKNDNPSVSSSGEFSFPELPDS